MEWKDKVAVVTGAGGTLCSVIAEMLAAKGCKVVLIGRTVEKLEKTAQAIKAAGGIDLQVLGIGSDGHIAFNAPGSSLASRTRLVSLTPQTIKDNARFFAKASDVPRHALSMGVGTICESKKIVLLAFGANKADAV